MTCFHASNLLPNAPEYILQPIYEWLWYMSDCICICGGLLCFSWKLSTVEGRRELCILKMAILFAKPCNKCDITAYGTHFFCVCSLGILNIIPVVQ